MLSHFTGDALCALAECEGDDEACMKKLKDPAYREEITIASDVCNMNNYVRKKPKKSMASVVAEARERKESPSAPTDDRGIISSSSELPTQAEGTTRPTASQRWTCLMTKTTMQLEDRDKFLRSKKGIRPWKIAVANLIKSKGKKATLKAIVTLSKSNHISQGIRMLVSGIKDD